MSTLRMPEVLAGVTEARIASWLVAEGDTIAAGAPVAEVETEKALVDLPAEVGGTIGRLLVAVGETVAVGTPLATVRDGDDTVTDEPPTAAPATTAPLARAEASPMPAVSSTPASPEIRKFTSPLARRLARERGIDITKLRGSGPRGRVMRRDVENASPAPDATGASPRLDAPRPAAGTRVPHTPMRRAIARRLAESKATVPHFYLRADCRVDALLDLRARLNEVAPVRLSVNDLVVKAVAVALARVPEANVTWEDDATLHHDTIDVAVAVSTDTGLVTPVARDLASASLVQVSMTIADLVGRARTGRLKQPELEGGSFTVTNLGMFGTQEFAAIINPPHAGILAVGAASPRPVVTNGGLDVATMMTVTLSADHRVLDGELAARWLAEFVRAVEQPISLTL